MYIVNKNYIKLDKIEIFSLMVKMSDANDYEKTELINDFKELVLNYEEEKNVFIKEIYIPRDSFFVSQFSEREIPLERKSISNAILLALLEDKIEIAIKLKEYLPKSEIIPSELGDLLDFVLCHSLNIEEYFGKEREKIIYDEEANTISKGIIYKITPQEDKRVR